MRRRFTLLFAPAVLVVPALIACDEDPSFKTDFDFDAGSLGDVYAPPYTPDGGATPDGSTAPDAEAPLGVTVTVRSSAGPSAGVPVVFHDEAGTVIEAKSTGSDGKATSFDPKIAMATALLAADEPSLRHLMTWTGVELGDELDVREPEEEEVIDGYYDVTITPPANVGDDVSPRIYSGACRGGVETTTGTITMYRGCAEGTGAVLARLEDSDFVTVGHAFKKGNGAPTNGATVNVATPAWQDPGSFELTLSRDAADPAVSASFFEIAGGQVFNNDLQESDGPNKMMFAPAAGFADAYLVRLETDSSYTAKRTLLKRMAPGPSATVDVGELLPEITEASFDDSIPLRPRAEWSLDPKAPTDGGLVRIGAWIIGDGSEAPISWSFVVGPGAKSVTAPALPDGLAFIAPGATIEWHDEVYVRFVDSDALPSYAALRRATIWPSPHGHHNNIVKEWTFSTNGTYRTTSLHAYPL